MAPSKMRVEIPSKLIATIAIAFILAWLVTADENYAHRAKAPFGLHERNVQGIDGHKCYRCFSSEDACDDAEKKGSVEVKGSDPQALIGSKAEKKLFKGS